MSAKRILVVEDDADSACIIEAYLRRDGFDVALAGDGQRGIELHRQWKPDLILLDIMLPKVSGTAVLSAVRRFSETPIIMVTAMGDDTDKLGALRYGADDYVVKPYNPNEVVARVHAVLRRVNRRDEQERYLRHDRLILDLEAVTACVETNSAQPVPVELTPTEFKLLSTLLKTPSKAFTREALLEVCLPDSDALLRVVDAHIHNLRRKLESYGIVEVLVTVRSVGYRFR